MRLKTKWWAANEAAALTIVDLLGAFAKENAPEGYATYVDSYPEAEGGDEAGPQMVEYDIILETQDGGRRTSSAVTTEQVIELYQGVFIGEFLPTDMLDQSSLVSLTIEADAFDMACDHLQRRLPNLEDMVLEAHNKGDGALDTVAELSMQVQALQRQVEHLTKHVRELKAVPFNTIQYAQLARGVYSMAEHLGLGELIAESELILIH